MRPARLALGSAAVALALTTLVGCSDDDDADVETLEGLTGEEVREASIDAMDDLTSMRITGDLSSGEDAMSMDIAMDRDGNCTGTWSLGGAAAEIRSDGEYVFLDGDQAFWTATTGSEANAAQAIEQLDGKWARMLAGQLDGICSLDNLLEGINRNTSASVELGEVIDHGGRKALEVTTTNAEGEKSFGLVGWEDEHHLLQVRREGGEGGSFDLSEFDEAVEVEIPAEGDFVDFSGD